MGGLSAAAVLAGAGWQVTLCEAGARVGGKANVAEVDGVEFDTGPSVVTLPHLLDGVFRAAGSRLEDELTLLRPDPGFRYRYPDGVCLDVYHAPDATRESIRAALGAETAREFDAFLAYARRIWDAAAPHFVTGPAPSPATVMRVLPQLPSLLWAIDPLSTFRAAIHRHTSSPHLRMLLERYATYNGSDARTCPATLNCIAWVELGLGVFGIEGGLYNLVRALERVAVRRGATIRTSTPVRRILCESGRVSGVALDHEQLEADAVICNADVAHVVDSLLEHSHGLRRPDQASMSGWTAVVRAKTAERLAHEVLFPSDYEAEFADIFDHDRPPREPTVYLCAQGRAHGRTTWSDAEPLFVMANAPPEPTRGTRDERIWPDLRETVRARLLDADLIGADDPIVWERTPRGLAQTYPGTRGALYGAASNTRFDAFKRPPNRWSRLPGLYLASGSAHPGGGVPLCVQSGRLAAEAVIADLG